MLQGFRKKLDALLPLLEALQALLRFFAALLDVPLDFRVRDRDVVADEEEDRQRVEYQRDQGRKRQQGCLGRNAGEFRNQHERPAVLRSLLFHAGKVFDFLLARGKLGLKPHILPGGAGPVTRIFTRYKERAKREGVRP